MSSEHSVYTVHKFGGSSLLNAASFRRVAELLTGHDEVIVVSATKGTSSLLQYALDLAIGCQDYHDVTMQLSQHHREYAESLLSAEERDAFLSILNTDIEDIRFVLRSIALAGDCPKSMQDFVLSFGEQWAAQLLTHYLASDHRALYLAAPKVLFAHRENDKININWQRSHRALHDFIQQHPCEQLIITGFLAANPDGQVMTLDRNSGDYSAAIFAKLLAAKRLFLWKDVDGVFSADPQCVQAAFPVPQISYREALELAYFGAHVIHPRTITPAKESHIPITIKNTFHPHTAGTTISDATTKQTQAIKGISSIDHLALITIEGCGIMGVAGMAARVFNALTHISVIFISQASSEHSICLAVQQSQAQQAKSLLQNAFRQDIQQGDIEKISVDVNCALLAIVGDGMVGELVLAGKLCSILGYANVNIRAIAQGSSERNISLIIARSHIKKALMAVHAGFYLSPRTMAIGLIGPGLIGTTLLQQIADSQPVLQEQHINLCVRGIINSKKMLLSDKKLDLSHWQDQFAQCEMKANLDAFMNHIANGEYPHAVIIDCTASETIADCYQDFVQRGLHIITPNKKDNSNDWSTYQDLRKAIEKYKRYYLYETTVCAGLPVMTTIGDILHTGDRIVEIEGVVSGTLSYIFSTLAAGGKRFSAIIKEAKAQGYTEPDPRDDLKGLDVARKFICLARELGFSARLEDIQLPPLLPEALEKLSVDDFLRQLVQYDDEIEQSIQQANGADEQVAYVGRIDQQGHIQVGLKSFPKSHPFARLQGTDNMLIIHTLRYQQALIIQGPGAGSEVTAAGIFADLLRLVAAVSH